MKNISEDNLTEIQKVKFEKHVKNAQFSKTVHLEEQVKSYRLGHSTVYQIVIETCRTIVHRLMLEVMPTPTEYPWEQIAQDFWLLWNFTN